MECLHQACQLTITESMLLWSKCTLIYGLVISNLRLQSYRYCQPIFLRSHMKPSCSEMYNKMVETVALKRSNGAAMAKFIRNNVICRFGICKRVLFDNGTPSFNSFVLQLHEEYDVDNVKSSTYYPHRNGPVEATNKTLLLILSRMVYEDPKRLTYFLSLLPWLIVSQSTLPSKPSSFS